jgi:hypothetical protein
MADEQMKLKKRVEETIFYCHIRTNFAPRLFMPHRPLLCCTFNAIEAVAVASQEIAMFAVLAQVPLAQFSCRHFPNRALFLPTRHSLLSVPKAHHGRRWLHCLRCLVPRGPRPCPRTVRLSFVPLVDFALPPAPVLSVSAAHQSQHSSTLRLQSVLKLYQPPYNPCSGYCTNDR